MEELEERLNTLNRKLRELEMRKATLASKGKLLQQQAARISPQLKLLEVRSPGLAVRHSPAACRGPTCGVGAQEPEWSSPTAAACLADFANQVRSGTTVVDLTPEDGRKMTGPQLTEILKVRARISDASAS